MENSGKFQARVLPPWGKNVCHALALYIGYDNIIGETSTFEGGRLNSINPEEIRQGLGAVFL